MDQETLYTATKWELLRLLENERLSPLEMAKKTGGSLANISQQLRLLEMAGIVTSKRVPNRDKGQPRILYSLATDSCYVISTANSLVQKKRLAVNPSHQAVLKIWFLENDELKTYAEKGFWRVEEHLPEIKAILLDPNSTSPVSFYIVSDKQLAIPEIQQLRHGDETKQLLITQTDEERIKRLPSQLYPLYDPNGIFT